MKRYLRIEHQDDDRVIRLSPKASRTTSRLIRHPNFLVSGTIILARTNPKIGLIKFFFLNII